MQSRLKQQLLAKLWGTAGALLALTACGADEAGSWPAWSYGDPSPPKDEHAIDRMECKFDAGSLTTDTVGGKKQDMEVLKHVVLLMMENRSFDHYFSGLPAAGHKGVDGDDVATDEANPDGFGGEVKRYHETRFCIKSPGHEWNDTHLQYAAGKLTGFVTASNPGGGRAMGYHTEDDLPFYYYLAKSFAISARHFSSLMGPTQPNRLFAYLGTSCDFADGFTKNPAILNCGRQRDSILDRLSEADVSYRVYDKSGISTLVLALGIHSGIPLSIERFEEDARTGRLAEVSIVGASTGEAFAPPGDDDHGPFNPQRGQQFVARIVRALAANTEVWRKSALIMTYDEHGGYYDHVAPPRACDPEKKDPEKKRDYLFDQYGFRVPLLVISPWAKAGYVSHYDTDHTSILRFLEHWKRLPALTSRDANAWPLLDLFDFEQLPLDAPQWDDTLTRISPVADAQCSAYPDGETGTPCGISNPHN